MKQGGGGSKLWGREGERSQSNSLSPLSWRVRKGPPKLGNQFEFKGQEFQHTNSKFCIHWQVQCGHPFSVNWWYSWIFFFFFLQGSFYFCFCFGFDGNQGKKCNRHHGTEEKTWCGNRNTQKRQAWAHGSPGNSSCAGFRAQPVWDLELKPTLDPKEQGENLQCLLHRCTFPDISF